MTAYRQYRIQLKDAVTGKAIITTGGKAYVAQNGGSAKQTIYSDALGTAASNPVSLTRGCLTFWVLDTANLVDLYIQAPGGQWLVVKDVAPSGDNDLAVNTQNRFQSMVIPFAIADTTAATETSTGFAIPAKAEVLPIGLGIDVVTLDSTEDIDVGTLSSDTGDADGFMDGVLLTTAGFIKPSLLTSADTMGALLSVQDSANAGDDAPEGDTSMAGKTITYTLSTGTDTAAGFIHLPIYLGAS